MTDTTLAIVAPESLIVQVGLANNASEAVNVRDTVSALLASPSPFVAIDTGFSVGCVLSIVTDVLSVVEVTAVPTLPAASVNAIENVIAPFASSSATTTAHV